MSWLLYCNIELNISNSPSTVEMYLFIETYNCFFGFNYLSNSDYNVYYICIILGQGSCCSFLEKPCSMLTSHEAWRCCWDFSNCQTSSLVPNNLCTFHFSCNILSLLWDFYYKLVPDSLTSFKIDICWFLCSFIFLHDIWCGQHGWLQSL